MRLDRYSGQEPRFRVQRRQEDGTYRDVNPWDCFVLKRKDMNAVPALEAYALSADDLGDEDLAADVTRLASEWGASKDAKVPD